MYFKKDKYNTIKDVVMRNIRDNGYTEDQFFDSSDTPYMDQLSEAVEFVNMYIDLNFAKSIHIVGDYDVDGICATAIMYHGLTRMGCEVTTRLPRRFSEGYGLSEKIIDEIDDGLIITVDNGIAAYKAIEKAKKKGLSVIVTDHHLPPKDKNGNMILPPADIIVDPHVYPEKSEFEDYCGAGIAYRFITELTSKKYKDLMMLASLATVCDVMPLYSANRAIVKEGLQYFNSRQVLPGIKALIKALDLDTHQKEDDYGFKIGPVFNASGRLHDNGAERVLRLLKMKAGDVKLDFKAENLKKTNEKRKEITKKDYERVLLKYDGSRPIVVYDDEIGEGIIGLIAGKLTEQFHCPAIVFTKTEKEGIIKGSGRSIPEVHLKNALDQIQDKIVGYGGHAGAAGLSIELSKLDEFKASFKKAVGKLPDATKDVLYDLELDSTEIPEIVEELKQYEPYGEGNPRIAFHMVYEVDPKNFTCLGDDKSHMMIKDDNLTIMGFSKAEEYVKKGKPTMLDCIGYLSETWVNDKNSYKFELISFNE